MPTRHAHGVKYTHPFKNGKITKRGTAELDRIAGKCREDCDCEYVDAIVRRGTSAHSLASAGVKHLLMKLMAWLVRLD